MRFWSTTVFSVLEPCRPSAEAADRHRLGEVADLERDVEADFLADADDDTFDQHGLEAGQFDLNVVGTDRQAADDVLPRVPEMAVNSGRWRWRWP